MARSRNIKPAFFKDVNVISCSITARLLFTGLWCLAKNNSLISESPNQIKQEILPYDDVDIRYLLDELINNNLIIYDDNIIRIVDFSKFCGSFPKPESVLKASANRRARKRNANVSWADQDAIKAIYKESVDLTIKTGIKHNVDHEIPLSGDLVSGLHVENNLRVITETENLKKGNKLIEGYL